MLEWLLSELFMHEAVEMIFRWFEGPKGRQRRKNKKKKKLKKMQHLQRVQFAIGLHKKNSKGLHVSKRGYMKIKGRKLDLEKEIEKDEALSKAHKKHQKMPEKSKKVTKKLAELRSLSHASRMRVEEMRRKSSAFGRG